MVPEFEYDTAEMGEKGSDGLGERAVNNESGLYGLHYGYNSSMGADSFSYDVRKDRSGRTTIGYYSMEYDDLGNMAMTSDDDLLEVLYQLYRKHHIAGWEGYSKYNPNVLDGDGFTLNVYFNDRKCLSATGSNAYPPGYRDFVSELKEIMEPYLEKMRAEAIQSKITEGIHGNLTSVLATFIQRGSSGSDRYEVLLYRKKDENRKNFDVRITSMSGEFIEKGKYNYYYTLSDEDIDFDGIRKLLETHEIIKWHHFDKTADDPDNAEWFQVSFGFEGGSIRAMGTAHPENYSAFRKDFLKHIVKTVRDAETKYSEFINREK